MGLLFINLLFPNFFHCWEGNPTWVGAAGWSQWKERILITEPWLNTKEIVSNCEVCASPQSKEPRNRGEEKRQEMKIKQNLSCPPVPAYYETVTVRPILDPCFKLCNLLWMHQALVNYLRSTLYSNQKIMPSTLLYTIGWKGKALPIDIRIEYFKE